MEKWLIVLIAAVVALAAGIAIGFIIGGLHRKKVAEAAIGSAEQEANKIISDAIAAAEAKKFLGEELRDTVYKHPYDKQRPEQQRTQCIELIKKFQNNTK